MKAQKQISNVVKIFILTGIILLHSSCFRKSPSLLLQIKNIPDVNVSVSEHDSMYTQAYDMWFTQHTDHNNPKSETFPQHVVLNHVGFDRPTVVVIEGYGIYTKKASELSKLLYANQITIEHRFFNKSRPDSIPWEHLNIKQAAIDQHKIIQALKKIYPKKWISTGISKGGQTTMYHRRFFPDDVAVSVPYVAPFNFERIDPRIASHLKNVGTPDNRKKIHDFQIKLFKEKKHFLPLLKKYATEENYTFDLAGIDRAYDLNVLEYSFAFWQWNGDCKEIPDTNAVNKEIFNHWKTTAPFSFFADSDSTSDLLFTYQALEEIGFYDYDITPFKAFLKDTVNITFDYKLPEAIRTSFKPEAMQDIRKWVSTDADYMLYIYGENDPWAATAVNPSANTNSIKMINPNGNHRTRIKSFPKTMQDSIYAVLEDWLALKLHKKN